MFQRIKLVNFCGINMRDEGAQLIAALLTTNQVSWCSIAPTYLLNLEENRRELNLDTGTIESGRQWNLKRWYSSYCMRSAKQYGEKSFTHTNCRKQTYFFFFAFLSLDLTYTSHQRSSDSSLLGFTEDEWPRQWAWSKRRNCIRSISRNARRNKRDNRHPETIEQQHIQTIKKGRWLIRTRTPCGQRA